MLRLEDEGGVFLVAFGGEADVVELDFIYAELGYLLRQSEVIVLNFGVGGIGRDQLAVFAPGLMRTAPLDGEFADAPPPGARRGKWQFARWHACFAGAGSGRTSGRRGYRPAALPSSGCSKGMFYVAVGSL